MNNQFLTYCRRCGRQILMTQNTTTHRWYPCDPEILRFDDSAGDETYITPDGDVKKGSKSLSANAEVGYYKHRRDCAE